MITDVHIHTPQLKDPVPTGPIIIKHWAWLILPGKD
jgi:hypothetical protein